MYSRKKKFKHWWVIITILIIGIIVIFSYTLGEDRQSNVIEGTVKDGVSIVERIFVYPFKNIGNFFKNIGELNNARKENAELKKKLDGIKMLEAENLELKSQIESLKKELSIDQVLSEYSYINASVLSRNVGYWYNTITIDKGKKSKIGVGDAVINNSGLIGKVISVTNLTATVKLITSSDLNTKISVAVNHDGHDLYGLIVGYNKDNKALRIEGISNSDVVKEGDYVYTSGLSGTFPSGVLVGNVYSVVADEYGLSKIIEVTPSADFDDLNYVSVLKRKGDSKW